MIKLAQSSQRVYAELTPQEWQMLCRNQPVEDGQMVSIQWIQTLLRAESQYQQVSEKIAQLAEILNPSLEKKR